jgi:CspA family cold shock protein
VDCFQGRAAVPSGTVKWFNEERGYGFIKPDNSGRNVFVHVKEVQKAGYSSLVDGA